MNQNFGAATWCISSNLVTNKVGPPLSGNSFVDQELRTSSESLYQMTAGQKKLGDNSL